MAKRAYFWGMVLMVLSVVQGHAAQCPALQIDLARQFAADPEPGNRARLICDQQYLRATDRASAEAERAACLRSAETVFIPAYDNIVRPGFDCELTRPGQEISRVWGSEIDQAVAALLSAWTQPVQTPTGFSPASRNRRFSSLVRAMGFAMNQAFRAEAAFIRNDLNAETRDQRRANTTRKLTRRLGNLTRNRPDYNGPAVNTLVGSTNQAVDRIVAMALANPGIPAPISVVIQDGGNGVDLVEANAGVAVTVDLADDLWPGVQLNLIWGNQPAITVDLTAGDLATASASVKVPFATIAAQGDGPVTVSARLSHPAGATSLTLKSGTTVNLSTVPLDVRVSGLGTVNSTPPGIECGPNATCNAGFLPNAVVTLHPLPQSGWQFVGWAGDCTGTGDCSVTLNRARSVVANFAAVPVVLTANVVGLGTVSSIPEGIECGPNATCSADFPLNTQVTLWAVPQTGWVFTGWRGDCGGTGSCNVTLDQSRSVVANFSAIPGVLTTNVVGFGTVNSTPAGIACGPNASCSAGFPFATQVTLVAVPGSGWEFVGWSGDCSGTGPCTVTLDQSRSVVANFAALPVVLNVTVNGLGTVDSTPTGIACGANATCGAAFPVGTLVTLTATPQSGSVFVGWSGDCSGTGPCSVTLNQARSVSAQFSPLINLTVTVGNFGTVISSPAGINCPGPMTCSAVFPPGTVVTLLPIPDADFFFDFWSGDCSGSGACMLTLDNDKTVSAFFTSMPPPVP